MDGIEVSSSYDKNQNYYIAYKKGEKLFIVSPLNFYYSSTYSK